MSIVATTSVSDFFEAAVKDAMRSRGVTASPGAISYVVALLSDLAKPGSAVGKTLERPLTLLLDEALRTPQLGERFDRLRTLGDGVLYSSGFFADHFEARGVDTSYLVGIGRTAYDNANAIILKHSGAPGPDPSAPGSVLNIFGELSTSFADLVSVIGEVANGAIASGVATSKGLVKLYERWLKTGSGKIAETLTANGFVTPRAGARVFS